MIKYGAVKGGSTASFFTSETQPNELYRKMGQFMQGEAEAEGRPGKKNHFNSEVNSQNTRTRSWSMVTTRVSPRSGTRAEGEITLWKSHFNSFERDQRLRYAYLMEDSTIEFLIERKPCDLHKVGDKLDNKVKGQTSSLLITFFRSRDLGCFRATASP